MRLFSEPKCSSHEEGFAKFLLSLDGTVAKVSAELATVVQQSGEACEKAQALRERLDSYAQLRKLIESSRDAARSKNSGLEERSTPLLQEEVDLLTTNFAAIEPARRKRVRTTTGASRHELKVLDAAALIATQPPAGDELWFSHSVLCQVSLPRKRVEGTVFERRSGDAVINVQAGFLNVDGEFVQQIVPYGALPRVALAWITTEAIRWQTREINIGRSAGEFMSLIGYESKSGATYELLREQMNALAACSLKFGMRGRTVNAQPFEQFDAWVKDSVSGAGQQVLWPGQLTLSERFSNSLESKCVPLDARAIVALAGSALALDIYTWLANRLHNVKGSETIEWKPLRTQFGQEYDYKDGDKDFKKAFKLALNNVLAVYPGAKIESVHGGLKLTNSPPPVAKNYQQISLGKK